MAFSLENFRQQRLRRKRLGAWGFWGTVVFAMLDLTTPLPLVERGAFVFVSLTLMAIFAGVYYLGVRLPLEETIEIARLHNNQLKITDLTRELNVTIGTAHRILTALVQQGQAVCTTLPDDLAVTVYVFPELKANRLAPVTPAEWDTYRLTHTQEPTPKPANPAGERPRKPGPMDKQ
jgi:hypothetical protein